MCLTRSNMNCGPRYATEDIICYKVLYKFIKGIYCSPYMKFPYKLNERISSDFSFVSLPPVKMSPQKEYKFIRILNILDK